MLSKNWRSRITSWVRPSHQPKRRKGSQLQPACELSSIERLEAKTLLTGIPVLNSNPAGFHRIYLDFDGHTQQPNVHECSTQPGISVPISVIGSVGSFANNPMNVTAAEAEAIHEIWQRVAEDFAPFNVNVTTVEPSSFDTNPGTGWAVRVAIGANTTDFPGGAVGYAPPTCAHHEIAYHDPLPNVAFVNATRAGYDPAEVATAASHEAAHIYGLNHFSNMGDATFRSAIMNAAPWAHARQTVWAQGVNEFGRYQDDVFLLTDVLGQRQYARDGRTDDYGSTIATSEDLLETATIPRHAKNRLSRAGIIETLDDRDVFSFRVEGSGYVNIRVMVGLGVDTSVAFPGNEPGPNLSATMEVRSATSNYPVATYNTASLHEIGTLWASQIQNPFSRYPQLEVGKEYFVVVKSHGTYGDLGNYTVIVDGDVSGLPAFQRKYPVRQPARQPVREPVVVASPRYATVNSIRGIQTRNGSGSGNAQRNATPVKSKMRLPMRRVSPTSVRSLNRITQNNARISVTRSLTGSRRSVTPAAADRLFASHTLESPLMRLDGNLAIRLR